MTHYDDVEMHPDSGMTAHPLAGVPQEALDAATKALREATSLRDRYDTHAAYDMYVLDAEDWDGVESIAHAVLMAGLQALGTRIYDVGFEAGMRAARNVRNAADTMVTPEDAAFRAQSIQHAQCIQQAHRG